MEKKKQYITTRKIGHKAIKWLLCIAAYAFLAWKLATFKDYPTILEQLQAATPWQYILLFAAIILVPINIWAEACKWKYLLKHIEPMTIREAQKQVYFGFMGAILTPARLGDYPTRVLRIEDPKKHLPAIVLGFVGTFALSFVMICGGIIALLSVGIEIANINHNKLIGIASFIAIIIFISIGLLLPITIKRLALKNTLNERSQRIVHAMAHLHKKDIVNILLLSILRYLTYCLQLWLILQFCGLNITTQIYLTAIPIYYMFLTITPSFAIADIAIRGSMAIIVFSAFTSQLAPIAIAAMLLWLLNTLLPTVIGSLITKK